MSEWVVLTAEASGRDSPRPVCSPRNCETALPKRTQDDQSRSVEVTLEFPNSGEYRNASMGLSRDGLKWATPASSDPRPSWAIPHT